MPKAEFEEKSYEAAANSELATVHNPVYAPGQVLENIVGYDAANYQPANSPVWSLLGIIAPPGARLIPNFWQRAPQRPRGPTLPSQYVSLILQYKRPTRVKGNGHPHWHNQHYFEIEIVSKGKTHQRDTLVALEGALGLQAAVRYAGPAFYTYAQLYANQVNGIVLTESNFVSPAVVQNHDKWTYSQAGVNGFANPNPEGIRLETFRMFWSKLRNRSTRKSMFQHLRMLAEGLEAESINKLPQDHWVQSLELSNRRKQAVYDFVHIAESIKEAESAWFVVDFGQGQRAGR